MTASAVNNTSNYAQTSYSSVQTPVAQQTTVEPVATIENNLRVILMGYIKSDPNDPDYPRKIASKYFSAAHHTDVYRKNMEHMKGSYGDFEAFYVESLVINGRKINSHPFAHHLNLTVEPGTYDAEITVVVKHHFAGYVPSKLASERPNASEFWPTNVAKKRWVKYRKTLTKQITVLPGKVGNLVYFVELLGEWYRVYDQYSGSYEGKEFKNVFTEFTLIKTTNSAIQKESYRGGLYYQLSDEDFITVDDIGKKEYDPFSPISARTINS